MRKLVFVLGVMLSATGCGVVLTGSWEPYGIYGSQPAKPQPRVATPEEVPVYMATSPAGFTLRENELQVEEGYAHRILGRVRVETNNGWCMEGATQDTVVEVLQQKAFEKGGTAVIYAQSRVPPDPLMGEVCRLVAEGRTLGSGWVVVLAPDTPDEVTLSQ